MASRWGFPSSVPVEGATPFRFRSPWRRVRLAAAVLLAAAAAPAAPEIVCEQRVHNAGVVDSRQAAEHTYVIWNRGTDALEIRDIRACCGASAQIADRTVAPGTNTALRIVLHAMGGRSGRVEKSFYIESNDPRNPYYQIWLVAERVEAISVDPPTVRFVGIDGDRMAETEVRVVCRPEHAFLITNVVSTLPRITAEFRRDDACTYVLTVRTVPPLPEGSTHAYLRIQTDSPHQPLMEVPVVVTVFGELIVVPRELVVSAAGGQPLSCFVALRTRNGQPFRILQVKPPASDIEVHIAPLGENGYKCELRGLTPRPDLDGRSLVLITDLKKTRDVVIPLRVRP